VTTTPDRRATRSRKAGDEQGQLVALKRRGCPSSEAVEERFGIDRAGWKALVEAIYPTAETATPSSWRCPTAAPRPIQAAGPHCADVVERRR
jgi:hypothetical protein